MSSLTDKAIARAKAQDLETLAAKEAEIASLKAQLASFSDPQARAEAECKADATIRRSFSSKAPYVAFRKAELAGKVTLSKRR